MIAQASERVDTMAIMLDAYQVCIFERMRDSWHKTCMRRSCMNHAASTGTRKQSADGSCIYFANRLHVQHMKDMGHSETGQDVECVNTILTRLRRHGKRSKSE